MNNNIAIIVNTHSTNQDLWKIFTFYIQKYACDLKIYVFSDLESEYFLNLETVKYKTEDDFTTQYRSCLSKIKEKYCITLNDDFILTDRINLNEINRIKDFIEINNQFSFVRLFKADYKIYSNKNIEKNLYLIHNGQNLFSQTATLWNKNVLIDLYNHTPKGFIGKKGRLNKHQKKFKLCTEVEMDKVAQLKKLKGLYYYNNEKKRGYTHYDSSILPHINSAIVGGSWNFKEYKNEIKFILKELNINSKRKIFRYNFGDQIRSKIKKFFQNS